MVAEGGKCRGRGSTARVVAMCSDVFASIVAARLLKRCVSSGRERFRGAKPLVHLLGRHIDCVHRRSRARGSSELLGRGRPKVDGGFQDATVVHWSPRCGRNRQGGCAPAGQVCQVARGRWPRVWAGPAPLAQPAHCARAWRSGAAGRVHPWSSTRQPHLAALGRTQSPQSGRQGRLAAQVQG